jgi:hypothetical protein
MYKTKPVFIYVSKCCNVAASKEPCERTKEEIQNREFGQHTLGTWRCGKCDNVCAVTPHKNTKVTNANS